MRWHQYYNWDCFTPHCNHCKASGQIDVRYKDTAIERWNRYQTAERQRDEARKMVNDAVGLITGHFPTVAFTGDLSEAVTWLLKEVSHQTDMACQAGVCNDSAKAGNVGKDPLDAAVKRMEAVSVEELAVMLSGACYPDGAERIRARLIEAAKATGGE